jgi:hypothetical protein
MSSTGAAEALSPNLSAAIRGEAGGVLGTSVVASDLVCSVLFFVHLPFALLYSALTYKLQQRNPFDCSITSYITSLLTRLM